ncbi:MAG: MarR family winged helix-turn-helix transcriptional regulator [Bacteroidota bacterium]
MIEIAKIKQLIDYWASYRAKYNDDSLSLFGQWLAQQPVSKQKKSSDQQEQLNQLGHHFGRLANFSQLWAKLAFQELPIRHFEDFVILSHVYYQKNPTKNELATVLVNEKSTVFEIIKRLIKEGVLSEHKDKEDKRTRRVELTKEGKGVFEHARVQSAKVAKLLVGHSSDSDIQSMFEKFRELDHFHTALHTSKDFDSIDEVI